MTQQAATIPVPVVRRFTKYLSHVQGLRKDGARWVSSSELADALGLTSSTVRQDLSHLDISGISRRGYDTDAFEEVLHRELDGGKTWSTVIVGAGNMGRALASHQEFEEHGFKVQALFDRDESIVGRQMGGVSVKPIVGLSDFVRENRVDLGIIAVPSSSAQEVADQLVAAGLKGILNLARSHVKVPEDVVVLNTRLLEYLQELACLVQMKHRTFKEEGWD
jgi:redox-sensing transcriptional repressor